MSNTGEEGTVPPPLIDEDGNLIVVEEGSKTGTSMTPIVEELMKKLEKLNTEIKKLKTKDKAKSIPPQAKMVTPHLKRKSPTKEE
jgi:molybdenum-dependent DNA-binding transcriptional regulator ModE